MRLYFCIEGEFLVCLIVGDALVNYACLCFVVISMVVFVVCRGTCQPYCRSLPDDPLLECFESTDDIDIQGLFIILCRVAC